MNEIVRKRAVPRAMAFAFKCQNCQWQAACTGQLSKHRHCLLDSFVYFLLLKRKVYKCANNPPLEILPCFCDDLMFMELICISMNMVVDGRRNMSES